MQPTQTCSNFSLAILYRRSLVFNLLDGLSDWMQCVNDIKALDFLWNFLQGLSRNVERIKFFERANNTEECNRIYSHFKATHNIIAMCLVFLILAFWSWIDACFGNRAYPLYLPNTHRILSNLYGGWSLITNEKENIRFWDLPLSR